MSAPFFCYDLDANPCVNFSRDNFTNDGIDGIGNVTRINFFCASALLVENI